MNSESHKHSGPASPEGSGAIASSGGVASGAEGNAAGRDVVHNYNNVTKNFIITKGVKPYKGMGDPSVDWKRDLERLDVSDLRDKLLRQAPTLTLNKPVLVTVRGMLYPCALLKSGWWESHNKKESEPQWQNPVQEWLFRGFHEWGPSWDFSWHFEDLQSNDSWRYFIAQLGDGDEANSISVIIPAEKAKKLQEVFQQKGQEIGLDFVGSMVEVTGVLCHRSHCPQAARLGMVGGILDYCLWLKEGEASHKIVVNRGKADLYSGYLWKCLAPQAWVKGNDSPELNQVYFVWEHTNFANESSIKYNLDSLDHKEAYIRRMHGNEDLILLQKSSLLVPGPTKWSKQEFYDFFLQKEQEI